MKSTEGWWESFIKVPSKLKWMNSSSLSPSKKKASPHIGPKFPSSTRNQNKWKQTNNKMLDIQENKGERVANNCSPSADVKLLPNAPTAFKHEANKIGLIEETKSFELQNQAFENLKKKYADLKSKYK